MDEYTLSPTPPKPEYVRSTQYNPVERITYTKKIYVTRAKIASWPAVQAGIFNLLLLETGAPDNLLLETGAPDDLLLEESSSAIYSLFYIWESRSPFLYGGVATGVFSGDIALEDTALVFPEKYFDPGRVLTLELAGKITANTVNSDLTFEYEFPRGGTIATIAMPATVNASSLSDFILRIHSVFGYDDSNTGRVVHYATLIVKNTTTTDNQSTTVMSIVDNQIDYSAINYMIARISWTTQNAGNDATLNTMHIHVN